MTFDAKCVKIMLALRCRQRDRFLGLGLGLSSMPSVYVYHVSNHF
jgi:hypothetical protein